MSVALFVCILVLGLWSSVPSGQWLNASSDLLKVCSSIIPAETRVLEIYNVSLFAACDLVIFQEHAYKPLQLFINKMNSQEDVSSWSLKEFLKTSNCKLTSGVKLQSCVPSFVCSRASALITWSLFEQDVSNRSASWDKESLEAWEGRSGGRERTWVGGSWASSLVEPEKKGDQFGYNANNLHFEGKIFALN